MSRPEADLEPISLGFFPFLSGLAHELNNPLTGILGYAQLLKESFPESSLEREDLEEIYRSSLRCRELVGLLARLGGSEEERPLFDPAQLVSDFTRLLEPVTRRREVRFTAPPPEKLPAFVRGTFWTTLGVLLTASLGIFERLEPGGRMTLEARAGEVGAEVVLAFSGPAPDEAALSPLRRLLRCQQASLDVLGHPIGACYRLSFKVPEDSAE